VGPPAPAASAGGWQGSGKRRLFECARAQAGLGAALLGGGKDERRGGGGREAGGEGGGAGIAALVSAKEERDLAALLELFALGVGDVDQFQERLQAELAALEVAARGGGGGGGGGRRRAAGAPPPPPPAPPLPPARAPGRVPSRTPSRVHARGPLCPPPWISPCARPPRLASGEPGQSPRQLRALRSGEGCGRRAQAANVHAVLEGGGVVAGVLGRAADAGRAVEDLAESLTIFDLKLRHMREARRRLQSVPHSARRRGASGRGPAAGRTRMQGRGGPRNPRAGLREPACVSPRLEGSAAGGAGRARAHDAG